MKQPESGAWRQALRHAGAFRPQSAPANSVRRENWGLNAPAWAKTWSVVVIMTLLLLVVGCQKATQTPARPLPTPLPTSDKPAVQSPAWARDAVMYQIFVRSFADSNGDGIGDLNGITQRLDYLQELGVNMVWLTPIFASASYHGYDTTDYTVIDPAYGTRDDLVRLVQAAHQRHIRVLLDFVAGHTSNQHPFFKDAFGNPQSKYSEFYRWTNEQHTAYEGFAGLKEMPSLNHKSEAVQQYLVDVAKTWLDLDGDGDFKNGIDGYRLDYALGVSHEFWQRFRRELKAVNPDALLLGEVWQDSVRQIQPYFDNELDAAFDFPLYKTLQGSNDKVGDGVLPGQVGPTLLTTDLYAPTLFYPPGAISVGFINNHDTNRVMSDVGGDTQRARTAATFLMTIPDVPIVYYGEEIGMRGVKGGEGVWDAPRREPMDWYASEQGPGMTTWWRPPDRNNKPGDGVSVEEEKGKPDSLLEHYRALIKLRLGSAALKRGSVEPVKLSGGDKAYAFVRRLDNDAVLAVFNFGNAPATLDLDLTDTGLVLPAYQVSDALTGKALGDLKGTAYKVDLPAGGSALFILKPR